ncbi:MAG TPA: hypothetical protein VNN73_04100 [Blastocatellia bacterium]|nr:hypothetical protein [Blastocatellia bacterium]
MRELRVELAHASLVGQLPLDSEDIQILQGMLKAEFEDIAFDFSTFKEHGRLSLSCFLVWAGIKDYEEGAYWPSVISALGINGDSWQQRLGELFLDALKRYEFTIFRCGGHRFVTQILLHGGIPDHCLNNYFEKVLYPIAIGKLTTDVSDTEELIHEWRARTSLYQTTDKPVRRFLEEGGKPAADFFVRCIEMAEAARDGERALSPDEIGLPERIVQKFSEWWNRFSQPMLTERAITLNRPYIEMDLYGEVRCILPEQVIPYNGDSPIFFHAFADDRSIRSVEILYHVKGNRIITDSIDCYLPPASSYAVRLEQAPHLERTWSFKGLDSGWMAFDERGLLIKQSELPPKLLWIALNRQAKFDSNISEQLCGTNDWEDFCFCLIDVSNLESLSLVNENGETVELPLAVSREVTLQGKLLSDCKAGGLAVFTEKLPVVTIPLTQPDEINSWSIYAEAIGAANETVKWIALREVAQIRENGSAVIPLNHAALLGDRLAGEFRVKLKVRGALGHDRQLRFAFIRDFEYEFDRAFYLADETPHINALTQHSIKISSEDDRVEIVQRDGLAEISGDDGRFLTLNLETEQSQRLSLTVAIPRIRWTARGLANNQAVVWLSKPLEIQLEDFEASDDPLLIVQLPVKDKTACRLELEGADHFCEEPIRHGEARFNLGRFRDSIRALNKPVVRFSVSFNDSARGEQKIHTLIVRTRWTVGRFECRDIRTLSIRWEDRGSYRNRALRLWNLLKVWEPPIEFNIPDGVSEIKINVLASQLPAGDYRAELYLRGEFDVEPSVLPPAKNNDDVFEVSIGEQELISDLLSPQVTFRRYLMRRLAGYEHSLNLSTYELNERDLKDLARILVFLVSEARHLEAKQLWFADLRTQIRQNRVRTLMREEIKSLAETGDDRTKERLRELCQTIGLSVNSLIPFALNSNVQFDNGTAKFRGIIKWFETAGMRANEDPWDLVSLEYAHDQTRKVKLSFVSEMKPVSSDVPLTEFRVDTTTTRRTIRRGN